MIQRLFSFVRALRSHGIDLSPAEVLDAFNAIPVMGVERFVLRETLAACMVKTADDRSTFDALFDQFFPLAPQQRRLRQKRHRKGGPSTGDGGQPKRISPEPESHTSPLQHPARSGWQRHVRELLRRYDAHGESQTLYPASLNRTTGQSVPEFGPCGNHKPFFQRPWTEFDPADVERLRPAMQKLATTFHGRLARRRKRARRGALHFRATFRKAVSTGGLFVEPVFHRQRPRRPRLVALCDLSHSVATASQFFLQLLAAAKPFFHRTQFFAFVDRPVELEVERDHVQPLAPLDVYARSDFGNVLATLPPELLRSIDRDTVLLILGDGRNNYRPPRAEILTQLRHRSRAVLWVQPEDPTRWGTADSAFLHYAPLCTLVVIARSPEELVVRLSRSLIRYV